MRYVLLLFYTLKKLKRRIFNARFQNISFRGTSTKYFVVWVFSRSINRNQSFFPRCVDIPLFLILVIDMVRG
uniref:photosystem I subunit IX n=1 Tax=Corispermum chinganicum TaxID=1076197 RepID=UPI003002EBCE